METVFVHDKQFSLYIDEKKITEKVQQLAIEIEKDCANETPLFIGILNGSFVFCADFIRKYNSACEISFVKLNSYQNTNSTGLVTELIGLNEDVTGRTIVILEDIIDTGTTLQKIYDIFKNKPIKALKVATLFFKPDVFRKELHIDYVGFSIPDNFIIGYGLDYNEQGRNLPNIYKLSN